MLLTTTAVIPWWTDKPDIEGICALVFIIMCAGGMSADFPVLSAKNIEFMAQDRHSL